MLSYAAGESVFAAIARGNHGEIEARVGRMASNFPNPSVFPRGGEFTPPRGLVGVDFGTSEAMMLTSMVAQMANPQRANPAEPHTVNITINNGAEREAIPPNAAEEALARHMRQAIGDGMRRTVDDLNNAIFVEREEVHSDRLLLDPRYNRPPQSPVHRITREEDEDDLMGTDVYMYMEKKRRIVGASDGCAAWRCVDLFELNTFYYGSLEEWEAAVLKWINNQDEVPKPSAPFMRVEPKCAERNYHRFAVLAGVRGSCEYQLQLSGTGLPKDCSTFVREEFQVYGGNSAGWVTLRQLQEWRAKNHKRIVSGYMKPEMAEALKEWIARGQVGEEPHWICIDYEKDGLVPIRVEFRDTVLDPMIAEMQEIAAGGGSPDEVRAVFWFD